MVLSDLAAYAREKYEIQEQHKWADFPGFSVLAEPDTGKWAALLMRQWDSGTGEEIQRCDIRCGRECLSELRKTYLTKPFRMKGQNWVGVYIDRRTDPDVVFRLFDRAVCSIGQQRAYTVILENLRGNTTVRGSGSKDLYRDTAIPPREVSDRDKKQEPSYRDTSIPGGGALNTRKRPKARLRRTADFAIETNAIPEGKDSGSIRAQEDPAPVPMRFIRRDPFSVGPPAEDYPSLALPEIPQKIRDMMRLYEYRGESLDAKSRNFYRQGKFMEDYEDDKPWKGEYRRYYTTYNDLHLPQLRGYFTWRTAVRRGNYRSITTSLAYMYLYELLCGIGTASPEDGLQKMKEFEKSFLDAGYGDSFMRKNLHRWMLDFAVVNAIPVDPARSSEVSLLLEKELPLAVLRAPGKHTDEEIFSSLRFFGGKKLPQSPVVTDAGEKGKHLFAVLWKYLLEHYDETAEKETIANETIVNETEKDSTEHEHGRQDFFTTCFGTRKSFPWHPFANAIYYTDQKPEDMEYVLNECHSFRCEKGVWQEERYDPLAFDKKKLEGLLHAADRAFRKYLKTGHSLPAKPGEAWAQRYIDAVIAADLQAEQEAARPKITIDLGGLEKIRRDARITRDSLLTEEEMPDTDKVLNTLFQQGSFGKAPAEENPAWERTSRDNPAEERTARDIPAGENLAGERTARDIPDMETPPERIPTEEVPANTNPAGENPAADAGSFHGLPAVYTQILRILLLEHPEEGCQTGSRQIEDLIRERHLMPSIVTDTINEALYEEIGDNILACDGESMTLVEDYREELSVLFSL